MIILRKRRLHLRYVSQCQHLIQGNGCLPHPKHLWDHLLLASQVGHPLAYMQFKLQKWWEVEHIMGMVQEIQSNRLPVDMCSARKNLILKLLRRTNCSKAHTNKKWFPWQRENIVSILQGYGISTVTSSHLKSLHQYFCESNYQCKRKFVVQEVDKTLLYSLRNIAFYL